MRGYILDTDVVSLFAPGRKPVSEGVKAWLTARADRLFLSTISVGEIEAGFAKLRRGGGLDRADRLASWFGRFLDAYAERIIPFDRSVAGLYGTTVDRAWAAGVNPGFADAAIAATALRSDLHVVTRNIRHFRHFGTVLVNPDDLS